MKFVKVLSRAAGILVYLGLAAIFLMRLITGNGDALVPLIGLLLISGFSALFTLITSLTSAVKDLVTATSSEIELLLNVSQTSSLGKIAQNDRLN